MNSEPLASLNSMQFTALQAPAMQLSDSTKRISPVFPDEFSDLDESKTEARIDRFGDDVVQQLERARQKYLKALQLVEKHDTAKAAEQFELAIGMLNELASIPNIEANADFTDLVQSIIEDYEAYVQNIDKLDENSSIFVLRDRLFEEVDAARPTVETLTVPNVAPRVSPAITTIALDYNEFVEKNLAFLSGDRGRKFMKKWLERTGKWMGMLSRIAKEEGMPPEIVYLAMMESGLNPNAVSRAKAVGMWQFIQSTGEQYHLETSFWIDERRDVEKATHSAMHFLKDLYNELGDWQLALAAYNCGAGGVRRAIRKSGTAGTSFWEIRDFLPRETRNYVPLYIATTMITMDRKAYGFSDDSLSFQPPHDVEIYTINEAVNLSALAVCADIPMDSLKGLNPELVRSCTPPSKTYNLKIPGGTRESFHRRFVVLTDEAKRPWMTHVVARGETLSSISRKYGASASEIASINGIKGYKSRLRRGASLRIPIGATEVETEVSVAAVTPAPKNETALAPKNETTPAPKIETTVARTGSTTARNEPSRSQITHVVASGDNLTNIARRYGVRIADLRNWNDIAYDKENIVIGDALIVAVVDRPNSSASVERLSVNRVVDHTVAKGESLGSISTLYGTTENRIRDLNNMKKNAALRAGKVIKVESQLSKSELAAIDRFKPSGKPLTHKVRAGESLGSIAALYSVAEDDLKRWNADEVDGTTIYSGSRLKVFTTATQKGSAGTSTSKKLPKTYRVRAGDALTTIADKFGVSIEDIRRKNPSLRNSSVIHPGQRIRLQ
ncbi:MAG: LysM peptidoglycan-binding domain-containing protein [Ignavibacteria bacterium]|nr:LysM peptidoglycan-binding domain-containing protein [Ignavibacteria bacterium]